MSEIKKSNAEQKKAAEKKEADDHLEPVQNGLKGESVSPTVLNADTVATPAAAATMSSFFAFGPNSAEAAMAAENYAPTDAPTDPDQAPKVEMPNNAEFEKILDVQDPASKSGEPKDFESPQVSSAATQPRIADAETPSTQREPVRTNKQEDAPAQPIEEANQPPAPQTPIDLVVSMADESGNFSEGTDTVVQMDIGKVSDIDATESVLSEGLTIGSPIGLTASAIDENMGDDVTYTLSNDAGGLFQIDPETGVVTLAGSLDFESSESHSITVTAISSDGSSSSKTFEIQVTDDNEFDVSAISDTDAGANSVDENSSIGTSVGITASASDADGTDSVTYALSDDAGGLFAIDETTGEVTVAGALDREAAASYDIEVTATSTDGSTSTQSYTIALNDQDEFDVSAVTDSNSADNTLAEDAAEGTAVGVVASATDADATNSNVTYSVDDARFSVDADGTVRVAAGASFDFETEADIDITVTATSQDGSTSQETFTLDVTDVNESGVSAISDTDASANNVDENSSIGTAVGITASASDADGTDSVTYSLSDDAGGLFAIDETTGEVTVAGALDREAAASYDIEVTATSTDGSTSTQSYTIALNDQDEFDVSAVTDSNGADNTLAEDASEGTAVGVVASASDADATNSNVTYSVDDDRFTVDADGTVRVAADADFDYETEAEIAITVTATSEDGSTSNETFTLDVTDVNESGVSAISDTDASANNVDENSSIGTSVGITASASDADGTDSVTYSLSDDAGGLFAIDETTGEVTVAGALDREAAASYDIEVTATSTDGSTSTQSYTIAVNDLDEFDVSAITDTDASANSVDENAAAGTTVGVVASATDGDATNSNVTYSVDDARFSVDADGTVRVAAGASFDFETEADIDIIVTATSQDGSTSNETFTLDVTDVNESGVSAISDTDAGANNVDENSSIGTAVGITASASDADGTDSVTYALSDDAGGLFAIDETTGEVTVAGALDRETASSYEIEVTATSTDGSTSTQSYTIAVNDLDEFDVSAITDTDASANSVDENAAAGTTVGVVASATDGDATNSDVTYSLSDDAGGLFEIDATTGEVTTTASLDAETASSYDIEITATSTDGSASTQTFTIDVNNLMDEGPTDITFTGGTVNETVASGGDIDSAYDPSGTAVATLSTTDTDAGDTFTYTITNDPSGHYEIVGDEVRVKSGQTIDFETAETHDVTIEVTDAGGNTYSETITINVQDFEGGFTVTGANTVVAANGENTEVTGTSEEDTLTGNNDGIVDNLSGGEGDDTIVGGGDYTIASGGQGADTIDLTDGGGVVNYYDSDEAVQIDLDAGTAAGGHAEGDTLIGVEDIRASTHDDTLTLHDDGGGIKGFAGDDVITGGDGNDQLVGDAWDEKVDDGDDTISGGAGDDSIRAGGGDDTITGGADNDDIDGGAGTDTAIYSGNWSDYTITEDSGTYTIVDNRSGSPDGTDTVVNVENFEFADGTVAVADLLNTGPTDITFTGGTVNESVASGGDIDSAYDPSGSTVATLSTADGNGAIDSFTYEITNDPSGHYEIVGNEVRVKSGQTIDFEAAESHEITVQVTDAGGNTYSETITINVQDYEGGFTVTGANTVVNPENGENTLVTGTSEEDVLTGNNDGIRDNLDGGEGDDTIVGGGDYVFATGGEGADSIDLTNGGGAASYADSDEAVQIDLDAGTATGGHAEGDILTGVEDIRASAHDDTVTLHDDGGSVKGYAGDDVITGGDGNDHLMGDAWNEKVDDGNDTIAGGVGNDTIQGGGGDDTITGGADNDDIDGGSGTDTAIYSGNWSDYTVTEESGTYTIVDNREGSPDGTDTVTNVEHFEFADGTVEVADLLNTGPTDITFTGGTVNERVFNGGTIDTYYNPSESTVATLSATDANSGDSFTYAITDDPSGHYEIVGDEVRVKSGQTIDFESDESHDITIEVTDSSGNTYSETITINVQDYEGSYTATSAGETFTGTSEEDTLTAHADGSTIDGSSGDDTLHGDIGDDTLSGGSGYDTVYGGDGDDVIDGGDAADTLYGGDGNDIIEAGEDLTVGDDDVLYGGEGNDTLTSVETDSRSNDTFYGEEGDDTITSQGGADILDGGTGDDRLSGGTGDDSLDGGDETDTAVYSGNWSDYTITEDGGTYTIADNRSGSPDGTDEVVNVENFEFADGTVGVADLLDTGPTDITFSAHVEDFEGGATGWTNNTTTDSESSMTEFLGRFGNDSGLEGTGTSFSVADGADKAVIEFDLYRIDSWDSGDSISFEVAGETFDIVLVDVFGGSPTTGSSGDVSWSIIRDDSTSIDGFNDSYGDSLIKVSIEVSDPDTSVDFNITANLDYGIWDESFGIDNVQVSALDSDGELIVAVDENASDGTVVATLSATDNALDSHSYTITNDPSGHFEIVGNEVRVASGADIDFEDATSHDITIEVTDAGGNTYSETVTVNVNDLNEGPTDITFTGGTVNETVSSGGEIDSSYDPSGTTVATLSATDEDSGDTFTYAITNDPSGHYEIVGNEVRVKSDQEIDFETAESHDITIEVTDAGGNTYSETITINVQDFEGSYTKIASDQYIDGTSEEDVMTGDNDGSSDYLGGGDGDDTIISVGDYVVAEGGEGADTIDFTDGDGAARYFSSDEGVNVNLADGTASGGDAEGDTFVNVDDLRGSRHDDTLTGNDNGSRIEGDDGSDQVYGGDGDDTLMGDHWGETSGDGDDYLDGGAGSDVLRGGGGDDTIIGGTGDDYITSGSGDDTIDGGADTDKAYFTGNWSDYTITEDSGTYTIVDNRDGSPDGTDTVTNVENFDFADGIVEVGDLLNVGPTDITPSATSVDENTSAGSVVATLTATDADALDSHSYAITNDPSGFFEISGDQVVIASGADIDFEDAKSHDITIEVTDAGGNTYSETVTVNVNDVAEDIQLSDAGVTFTDTDTTETSITGGTGDDTIVGGDGGTTIVGGEGQDNITGGDGDDTIYMGVENNTFYANGEVAHGGEGNDTIIGSNGSQTLYGDEGDDYITGGDDMATSEVDVLYGGEGNDTLVSGQTVDVQSGWETGDTLYGEAGDDRLEGGKANDTLDGGDDTDTAVFTGDWSDYTITEDSGTYTIVDNRDGSPDGTDTVVNVENFEFADGTVAVADLLNTGPTDITFTGGTVNETVADGGDIDSAYDPSGSTVATLSATDNNAGDSFTYTITNDPSGHYEIVGDEVRVKSGQTIDFETAETHDVTIEVTDAGGDTYSETITINVQDFEGVRTADASSISETGTSEEDTFTADAGGSVLSGMGGDDTLIGSESDDYLSGGDGDDQLQGGGGADTFDGDAGNDTIDAGAGDDFIAGGSGDDTIDGGSDTDTVYYSGNWSDYTITENAGTYTIVDNRSGSPDGTDTVTNVENFMFNDGTVAVADLLNTGPTDIQASLSIDGLTSTGGADQTVTFTNDADFDVTLHWVDFDGELSSGTAFAPGDSGDYTVGSDHAFVVKNTETGEVIEVIENPVHGTTYSMDAGLEISENSAAGAVVATLSSTDDNALDSQTYTITSDPSGFFEISGDQVVVKAGADIDFEDATSHDITIEVTDAGGNTYEETFTIDVSDVNEGPTDITFDANSSLELTDGDPSSVDAVVTGEIVGSGTNTSVDHFAITHNGGELTINTFADGYNGGDLDIDIMILRDNGDGTFTHIEDNDDRSSGDATAAASDGSTSNLDSYINISDLPAGNYILTAGSPNVTESEATDTSTDYANTNGNNISAETGEYQITISGDATVAVAENPDGGGTWGDPGNNIVIVNDGSDPATLSAGSVVATVADVADVDAGDTFTFTLTDDADGMFDIDSDTGEITLVAEHDASTVYSDSVTVQVTDAGGNTYSETIGINLGTTEVDDMTGTSDTDIMYGFDGQDSIDGGAGDDALHAGDNNGTVTGENLIVNGSFEADDVSAASFQTSFTGWTASSGRIELGDEADSSYGGAQASDGEQFVEMDAQSAFDSFYQDIATNEGETYQLSLDVAERPGYSNNDNGVEIYWNGELVAEVDTSSSDWETYTFEVTGTGGSDRLEFREEGGDDGSSGGLIDNISLISTAEVVEGGDGNDTIYGGDGHHILQGGDGNDTITDNGAVSVGLVLNDLGTDGYAEVSDVFITDLSAFSFETLMTISDVPASGAPIVSYATMDGASEHDNEFTIILDDDGSLRIYVDDSLETTSPILSVNLADGEEHRLSVTWEDSGDLKVYVDGVEEYSESVGGGAIDGGGTFIFGQEQDSIGGGFHSDQMFSGTMDDIRIFDDVRTATEIADNHNTAIDDPSSEAGLLANWQFDTEGETTVTDLAGGHELTLSGDASVEGEGGDILEGGAGNDSITGGAGNDTVVGGLGDDTLSGGEGDDLFIYETGDGSDSVAGGAGGGWTDVIDLQGMDGAVTVDGTVAEGTGWTMSLDSGSIVSQNSDSLDLSDDASGTIVFDDGATMTFTDIEQVNW